MSKQIVIVRGLPGSGKSSVVRQAYGNAAEACYAKMDVSDVKNHNSVVVSADHFFMRYGTYVYDVREIGVAHMMCRKYAIAAMMAGVETIVVDNTSVQNHEWAEYSDLANMIGGYETLLIDLFDSGMSDAELAKRCVHGVPVDKIGRMRDRYERSINLPQHLNIAGIYDYVPGFGLRFR